MTEHSKSVQAEMALALDLLKQLRWQAALDVFQAIRSDAPENIEITPHIASCLMALGRYKEALAQALLAISQNPAAWQPLHTAALALRMTGKLKESLQLLAQVHQQFPDVAEIRRDYGDFVCKVLGDWQLAEAIWQPLQGQPDFTYDLDWFHLKRRIYGGGLKAEDLAQDIFAFSRDHLAAIFPVEETNGFLANLTVAPAKTKTRKRIGLIATFFRATPVYYLCFGALKNLADDYDLIFFSRETIEDWATQAFKSIAKDWHDVKPLSPADLSAFLRAQELDVLIDMCGWLDQRVLQALGSRPATRLYKWVGGQSSSTGLAIFDGFFSDQYQSPLQFQRLYSEPLILLDSGYASYTPPAYLPAPIPGNDVDRRRVGVISHPMKVSQSFLIYLRQHMRSIRQNAERPISLCFIGWRYGLPVLQQRLLAAFKPYVELAGEWLNIKFIPTHGHEAFLKEVSGMDWIVDTFPYTSGVTALEALALGVPCRTRAGTLFSERHAYSHCRFSGLKDEDIDLNRLGPFSSPAHPKNGQTLLPANCPRSNHAAVADAMASVFENSR